MDFAAINRIPKSAWFVPHYLARARAGDLLLLGESEEKPGGLLRIRHMPVFISVTGAQVWEGAPIPWPRREDGISSLVLQDTVPVFNP